MLEVKGVIVPDYIEPIIAYRAFQIQLLTPGGPSYSETVGSWILGSTTYSNILWKPGEEKKAECIRGNIACDCALRASPFEDESPHQLGKCGIYSLKNDDWGYILDQAGGGYYGNALASVEIWGKVIEHEDGYRSEFARIKEVIRFARTLSTTFTDVHMDIRDTITELYTRKERNDRDRQADQDHRS